MFRHYPQSSRHEMLRQARRPGGVRLPHQQLPRPPIPHLAHRCPREPRAGDSLSLRDVLWLCQLILRIAALIPEPSDIEIVIAGLDLIPAKAPKPSLLAP